VRLPTAAARWVLFRAITVALEKVMPRSTMAPATLFSCRPAAPLRALAVGLLCALGASAWAQSAPGEDPLVLTKRVAPTGLPLNNQPRSTGLDQSSQMPAWMRAKVSRYTAKAYSANTDGIYTDADVVTTATTDGFRRSCTQEIATQTTNAANRFGAPAQDQIVVLRGDLVNICN